MLNPQHLGELIRVNMDNEGWNIAKAAMQLDLLTLLLA